MYWELCGYFELKYWFVAKYVHCLALYVDKIGNELVNIENIWRSLWEHEGQCIISVGWWQSLSFIGNLLWTNCFFLWVRLLSGAWPYLEMLICLMHTIISFIRYYTKIVGILPFLSWNNFLCLLDVSNYFNCLIYRVQYF